MKKKIEIKNKIYEYDELMIYLGQGKINKEIAKDNLLKLREILYKKEIYFVLFYGTLLGVIREEDLISYDQDIDIFLLEKEKFLNELFLLRKNGFEVARYDIRGIISLIRNGEYIDIYFFNNYKDNIKRCCTEFLPSYFLEEKIERKFLDEKFYIPQKYKEFLLFEYGKNWNIPIEYKYSSLDILLNIIMVKIKKITPYFIVKKFYQKKEKKGKERYEEKLKKFKENMK
ncbi:MAG: LicD family protein [Fusobacterium ulcerans]|uniref:LicD family protein n=1 Tax=Fusobacterium ulcerans TaxID=861 RepID=UPI003A896F3F